VGCILSNDALWGYCQDTFPERKREKERERERETPRGVKIFKKGKNNIALKA